MDKLKVEVGIGSCTLRTEISEMIVGSINNATRANEIVHCVNMHDTLVNALRDLFHSIDADNKANPATYDAVRVALRAAYKW